MMKDIKLSIIVPVYNTPDQLLRDCLDSLVNQNGECLEFIVLNDGSTDITCEQVIKEFLSRDPRLHYIHKENTGVSNTRNVGLENARGEYVMFVDGDDQLKSGACKYAIELMDNHDYDCAVLGFESSKNHQSSKSISHVIENEELTELLIKVTGADTKSYRECGINVDAPWAKVFRKSIINKNNISFPERLSRSEDAMFCLLYYEHSKKILLVSHSVYVYVTNEESLCRKCSDLSIRMIPVVFDEFRKYSESFHPNDERFKLACVRIAFTLLIEAENVYFFNPINNKTLIEILQEYITVLHSFPIKENRSNTNFKVLFPHINPLRFLCWKTDMYLPILIIWRLKNKINKI